MNFRCFYQFDFQFRFQFHLIIHRIYTILAKIIVDSACVYRIPVCSYILTKQQYSASPPPPPPPPPPLPLPRSMLEANNLIWLESFVKYNATTDIRRVEAGIQRYKYVFMNSNSWFTPSFHRRFAMIMAITAWRTKELINNSTSGDRFCAWDHGSFTHYTHKLFEIFITWFGAILCFLFMFRLRHRIHAKTANTIIAPTMMEKARITIVKLELDSPLVSSLFPWSFDGNWATRSTQKLTLHVGTDKEELCLLYICYIRTGFQF